MRRNVFIILIIVLSALYYFSTVESENSIAHKTSAVFKSMINNSTLNLESAKKDETMPQNASNTNDAAVEPTYVDLGAFNKQQFSEWMSQEAKSMDSTENNPSEVELRLRAQVKTLTPVQLKELVSRVHNLSFPINERILSGYLVTLSQDVSSLNAQFEIAKKALPDFGPVLAHSEAELKHSQELALRYMEVDELAARAKADANAFEKLKLLLIEAQSLEVRTYAARKLKDLNY